MLLFLSAVGHCASPSYAALPTQPLHISYNYSALILLIMKIFTLIKWYQLLGSWPKWITVNLWVAVSRLNGKRVSLYSHFSGTAQAIPLWIWYFQNILDHECIIYRKMQFQKSYGCFCFFEMLDVHIISNLPEKLGWCWREDMRLI